MGFGHHLTFKDYADKRVANLAMDCLVNCYVPFADLPNFVMADGTKFEPVTVASFPELNLEPKKDTKYYYDKLMQAHQQQSSPKLEGLLSQMAADGYGDTPMEHKMWESFENMTDAEKALMEQAVGQGLVAAYERLPEGHKSRGMLPGEIVEKIGKIMNPEPPKFNWRKYLRNFIGNSEVCGTRKTRRKDNERYPDNPALKVLHRKKILVGIDTSGSVSTAELEEFIRELTHIHKCGTEITVVQCDTAIRHIDKFKPGMEIHIHGRGGTILTPVLEYFRERSREYNCLIFFTDGGCEATPDWFKLRCLWVLSNRSCDADHLKPYVIRLEK